MIKLKIISQNMSLPLGTSITRSHSPILSIPFYKQSPEARWESIQALVSPLDISAFKVTSNLLNFLDTQSECVIGAVSQEIRLIHLEKLSWTIPYVVNHDALYQRHLVGARFLDLASSINFIDPSSIAYSQIFYVKEPSLFPKDGFDYPRLREEAKRLDLSMETRGSQRGEAGGLLDLQVIDFPSFPQILKIQCVRGVVDSQGANSSNEKSLALSKFIKEELKTPGLTKIMNILSNSANERITTIEVNFSISLLKETYGEVVIDQLIAHAFSVQKKAASEPDCAAYYNAMITEGTDSLNKATQNDLRAFRAGVHFYAATVIPGQYSPIFEFNCSQIDQLKLIIKLPTSVGTVGAATGIPSCRVPWEILGSNMTAKLYSKQVAAMGAVGLISVLLSEIHYSPDLPIASLFPERHKYLQPDPFHAQAFESKSISYAPLSCIPNAESKESRAIHWFFSTEEPSMVAGLNKTLKLTQSLIPEITVTKFEEVPEQKFSSVQIELSFSIPISKFENMIKDISADELVHRIVLADLCAQIDPTRAITSNKGVMNTIVAYLESQGYPTSLFEAVSHSNASHDGHYKSLTSYAIEDSALKASIKIVFPLSELEKTPSRHLVAQSPIEHSISLVKIGLLTNLAALLALVNHEKDGIVGAHNNAFACNLSRSIEQYRNYLDT